MSYNQQPMKWYMVIYSRRARNGQGASELIDLLANNFSDAIDLAETIMEPGEEVQSIGLMGTQLDYEIYDKYVQRRNYHHEKASQMVDVGGLTERIPSEMSAHELSDDDADF